jgi:3D (Asp-Asp-Asp) domain-containing protein
MRDAFAQSGSVALARITRSRAAMVWLAAIAGGTLFLFTLIGATRAVGNGSGAQLMALEADQTGDAIDQAIEQTAMAAFAPQVQAEPQTLLAVEPGIVPAVPSFDGRPLRKVREVEMLVTAYSPDARSCGKWADGVTASGYSVWTNGMKLVAADTKLLPFGSIITVPGYDDGQPVPVLDRGGKIKGKRLDLLYPTHESALEWGAQRLTVTVWEYAD